MTFLDTLADFARRHGFKTRGSLNIGLVMTRRASEAGLPLDPEQQLARSKGQVAGLNGEAGNRVLRTHGVVRSIGTEVGRTNRGSVEQMRRYVAFLNEARSLPDFDLLAAERFWVGEVVALFARKPFILRLDPAASVQATMRDLLRQAEERQRDSGGAMVVGTVLQHLVGAKLETALAGRAEVRHNSANANDEGRGRGGDFDLGDAALHVTAAPSEALIAKCGRNLSDGLRPIIITTRKGAPIASGLAEQIQLADRIEVLDIEQFVATNVHELGGFKAAEVAASFREIVVRYNALIDAHQSDPSLKISVGGTKTKAD